MDNQLTEEQEISKKEQFVRGLSFEEMANSQGFTYIKAYIENQVKLFANKAIMNGFKDMVEFEGARREVNGLRKLIGHIESDIQALQDERAKNKQQAE